jgi:predicted transcriptional regulator
MSAAPNILPIQTLTVVEWIRSAMSADSLIPVSAVHMNGMSERADVKEALESLALAHKAGGAKAAKIAWDEQVSKAVPDVADIVDKPRRLFHIDELANRPPQKWLIPGKIPDNALTAIFGASEAGKSFLAVDYAAQIARDFPIVYVAGEGQSGYYARYKAWLDNFGHKKSGQFYLYEDAVRMLDDHSVAAFIEDIKPIAPKLVVIDTLIRCFHGGDENSSKDMGIFTDACDRIRKAFGCAIIILHHVTKGTGVERGSGALRNNMDSMIEVINDEGMIKVVCSKTKDTTHWPTEYYKRQQVTIKQGDKDVTSCVLVGWQFVKTGADELTQNQASIIEILASEAFFDCGARSSELTAVSNIARSTLFSVLQTLMRRGYVKKPPKKSDPYFITPSGIELVKRKGLGNRHP